MIVSIWAVLKCIASGGSQTRRIKQDHKKVYWSDGKWIRNWWPTRTDVAILNCPLVSQRRKFLERCTWKFIKLISLLITFSKLRITKKLINIGHAMPNATCLPWTKRYTTTDPYNFKVSEHHKKFAPKNLTIKLHHCLLDHRLELTWKMNSTFNKSSMIEKKRKRKLEKYAKCNYGLKSLKILLTFFQNFWRLT